MALKGFLSIDIIATELSDNIFVSESRGRIKGLPNAHEQAQMDQKLNFHANGVKMRW